MKKFLESLQNRTLIMDGAMGTQLMERGIGPEDCFDAQNLKNPKTVEAVHKAYVAAGADIIETNTFGANRIKLAVYNLSKKVNKINIAAAEIARKAIKDKGFVCGSIGPLGELLDPLGPVTFDQAYEAFAEQAKALEEGGVDVICVETISDLQEMRAAAIAVKNETKLPLICSLTYDPGEKTIYGTFPEVAVVVLESIGADVIAANCSTGPESMLEVGKQLIATSTKPVMLMPNAGMPELVEGKAIYQMTPKKFGEYGLKFVKLGVNIVGGCCGTNPGHIRELKKQTAKLKQQTIPKQQISNIKFASRTKVVEVEEGKVLLVGERVNPTGRKLFREELEQGKMQTVRQEAGEQTKNKADLLDVNVSVPEVNEPVLMHSAVNIIQAVSDLPLCIDSPNHIALETGLKSFCGKALINSVNGKKESLDRILPLAKKYGAAVIALTLDERGVPNTAEERLRIAEKIVRAAQELGISKEQIFVDNLVMTAGIGVQPCLETLRAIPMVKQKLGVKTILGISNVSHGLPLRSALNALYLELAIAYGLDAAIVDVGDIGIKKGLEGLRRGKKILNREGLLGRFKAEVVKAKRSGKPAEKKRESVVKEIRLTGYTDIRDAVIEGDADKVKLLIEQAFVKKMNPQKIIDQGLLTGMEIVGKKFSKKEYFLPQVIESAEAMKKGFGLCQAKIPQGKTKSLGKVLLATVKGDVHDIGKNILKMLLENHGFKVVDLGKDVETSEIIKAAKKEKPDVIALSALLTTTMVEMGVVKEALKKAKLNIPLLIGGAVVTKGYADKIGAGFSLDAVGAVALAKKIVKEIA